MGCAVRGRWFQAWLSLGGGGRLDAYAAGDHGNRRIDGAPDLWVKPQGGAFLGRQAGERLGAQLVLAELVLEVHVDGDQRVRRVSEHIGLPGVHVQEDPDLSDFGNMLGACRLPGEIPGVLFPREGALEVIPIEHAYPHPPYGPDSRLEGHVGGLGRTVGGSFDLAHGLSRQVGVESALSAARRSE